MVISKDPPKRRKSIAVPNQNKPAVLPRAKRRPHSIVPGDRLSPFAKARRSLVPRKSILKTFTNILHNGNDNPDSQSQAQSESSSQPLYPSPSFDDADATQSMDITRDFHTKIQDNTTRKSLGSRRVSFAENVLVRVIEGVNKSSTNNTQSSQSSTAPGLSHVPTNENDYPGATPGSRRRSSARYSLANSEDMDFTRIVNPATLTTNDSAIVDEESDYDEDEDEMDMTDVIHGELIRKRSLSMGVQAPHTRRDQDQSVYEQSQLFEGEYQVSWDGSDQSQPMDFTMPLSKSKRSPIEHDAAWLALRQATHSGDTPIEHELSSDDIDAGDLSVQDEMELDDAVQRLMRARQSLPSLLSFQENGTDATYDASFSTDGSFEENGDQTINLSVVQGRASVGSTMDVSEVYGSIAVPPQPAPRQTQHQVGPHQEPDKLASDVFQPPPQTTSGPLTIVSRASPARSGVSNFPPPALALPLKLIKATSVPASPSKTTQAITSFSAAFAPPVTRPSPKRPRPSSDDGQVDPYLDKPSPAKRAAIIAKYPIDSSTAVISVPKPQPRLLSPSKKAPFQTPGTTTASQRQGSSLRRPSGYFAKRKSLGPAAGLQRRDEAEIVSTARSSPKKKAGLGLGRASVGSGSTDAWQRFSRDRIDNGQEKEALPHDRETQRRVAATPTPPKLALEIIDLLPDPPGSSVDFSMSLDTNTGPAGDVNVNMYMDPTEQWRNGVQPGDYTDNDDPPISIKQFFAITGIKFMDELTAPRRSTHPSQQTALQPRDSKDIPLAEYATAMGLDVPQLVLYWRVSKDLETWIEKSKGDFEQAEDEAAKITPELFTEYSRADEEGQAELLHQLQLIRTNTRALAKSDWYDWKLQWLEGLRDTADQTFKSLERDAKALEAIKASADKILPALQQEYEEVVKELEKETMEVAEIEACDQDYLNELKSSIAEQNIEVEALRAEVTESRAKLGSLQERLDGTNTEKQEANGAIGDAQRLLHIQKNGTRAEVFRLKDELESLEDLHMFRVTKVTPEMFEYMYADQYWITIPCKRYIPIVTRVDVTRVDKAMKKVPDKFPRLSDVLLHMAKEQIMGEDRTTRQIIHRLSDYWSSCAQLRAQLQLLLIKFPVEIQIVKGSTDQPSSFTAKVMVLFPSVKAKAFVSFVFASSTVFYWPVAIRSLRCRVDVVYGKIDRDIIANAVSDRLSQASPEDNYACLLDACIEAQEIYR